MPHYTRIVVLIWEIRADETIPIRGMRIDISSEAYPFTEAIDVGTGDRVPFRESEGTRQLGSDEIQTYKGIALVK